MEFEGGMYYLNKLSKNYKFYECKHYKLPQSGRVKKGYHLFASEIKLQLIEENRGCSYQEIIRLTGMAWRALPPERQDYYDRRAKVHRPQMMYGRCPGRLRFREVNGEMLTTVNELIDYAPHREELSIEISRWVKSFNSKSLRLEDWFANRALLSISHWRCEFHPTNSRLEQIIRGGAQVVVKWEDDQWPGDSSDLTNSKQAHRLDESSELDEFDKGELLLWLQECSWWTMFMSGKHCSLNIFTVTNKLFIHQINLHSTPAAVSVWSWRSKSTKETKRSSCVNRQATRGQPLRVLLQTGQRSSASSSIEIQFTRWTSFSRFAFR